MIDQSYTSEMLHEARKTLDFVRKELISQQTDQGHWLGQLSSSALSTATAISAIAAMIDQVANDDQLRMRKLVDRGVEYLAGQQNADGGFGDTDRSHSNIATSYLVLAAMKLADDVAGHDLADGEATDGEATDGDAAEKKPKRWPADAETKLAAYIETAGGIEGLRNRYGKDKTFVVPILSNLAIAGLVDWKHVPALPFEAAALPQSWYRLARMPVVSYAIPALVAIGQAKHLHCPSRFLPLRMLRSSLISRTLGVLGRIQPDSGGYLEATPLTAFVLMSLASSGRADHPVCRRGLSFLEASIRPDGSWPIDTNLATWVTSLSIAALSADPTDDRAWCEPKLVDWLLSCQHRVRHPFTGADPGGWGWTDLSGAVPDGDDTPAAILALRSVRKHSTDDSEKARIDAAVSEGLTWLVGLQNRDGGLPTFCRGWGKLPFDRSSTDLTAHAIRVWEIQESKIADPASDGEQNFERSVDRAIRFLIRSQEADGSWLPLWFGNQDREDEDNPFYGTAKILLVNESAAGDQSTRWKAARSRAVTFLVSNQNSDGGWGGGTSVTPVYGKAASASQGRDSAIISSTIEETSLVIEALVRFKSDLRTRSDAIEKVATSDSIDQAIIQGIEFLIRMIHRRLFDVPWPIGFYFAKLWYYEQLYPLIYTASALGHFLAMVETDLPDERLERSGGTKD